MVRLHANALRQLNWLRLLFYGSRIQTRARFISRHFYNSGEIISHPHSAILRYFTADISTQHLCASPLPYLTYPAGFIIPCCFNVRVRNKM